MFDLGFAAAGYGARTLIALARGENDLVVVAFGFDRTGQRQEACHRGSIYDAGADDDALVETLVSRGVLKTIDMTVDHEHGELLFRCMDHDANRRVHWALRYELSSDRPMVSSIADLGSRWEQLTAGFRAGLADAPVEHDAFAPPYLKISFGPPA